MKRVLIQLMGWLFVTYALLSAYVALDTLQAGATVVAEPRSYNEPTAGDYLSGGGVDQLDAGTTVDISDEYFVEIWITEDCEWCTKFEDKELAKIKKSGVRYKIFDTAIFPPPDEMTSAPCIRVFRLDMLMKQFNGYVKAEKVLGVVVEKARLLL